MAILTSVLAMPLFEGELTSRETARLRNLEKTIQSGLGTFYEVGKALQEIRDSRLYRKDFKTFEEYCRKRWEMQRAHADRLIGSSAVIDNLTPIGVKPTSEGVARALTSLEPDKQREAWKLAVDDAPNGKPTGSIVKKAVLKIQSQGNGLPPLKTRGLFIPTASELKEIKSKSRAEFNNQGDNDNIEWARWSWNPVTGCLHGCDFCYARDIANRFYDQGFAPTFLPERLAAPINTEVPERAESDVGWKNVFVCSMADLWGKWVPRKIIDLVLAEVRGNPQWNFLFLTKFPARYEEFADELPSNAWMGTTVVEQANVDRAEKAFWKLANAGHQGVRWLSIEPMYERIQFNQLELFDWIVVGGASASSKTDVFVPPIEWYLYLHEQAMAANVQFYMKSNIRFRQYPPDRKA
jgi:protein gp37